MSLYDRNSRSVQTLGKLENLTLVTLKDWWKTLTRDDQETFCCIDSENVIPEMINASNKAYYLCRMSQAYRKKDLVSKGTIMDENAEARNLMIQFNLVGKDIVKNGWAELLSCFYLNVPQDQKSKEHSLKIENMQEAYIGVKRDKLDDILDLLANTIPNFGEGDKPVSDGQALCEVFPIILEKSSELVVSLVDLKPDLKRLIVNLVAIANLIERQIYLAYFSQVSSKINQTVVDQFNFLSSQFENLNEDLPSPLMIKTISQLEKSAKLGQTLPVQSDLDDSPSFLSTRSRFSEEFEEADPMRQFYEEIARVYDGFIMDDLIVEFEPSDCVLTANDEESLSQSSSVKRQHDAQEDFYQRASYVNYPMHFSQQYGVPSKSNFGMPRQMAQMPNYGDYYSLQEYQTINFPNSGVYANNTVEGYEDYPQTFQPHMGNYNSHFAMGSMPNSQEQPRCYPRPQLPPRLQMKKDQIFH